MLDLFNLPTPQGCNIQTFYGTGTAQAQSQKSWIKPRGISNVYILLIGAGGPGNGTTGGGSGAVTVWYGSAQNVPDQLTIRVGISTIASQAVFYNASGSSTLLLAASSTTINGATAMTANQFTAQGFFQSIAGQNGANGDPTASSTTFLGGGSGSSITTANYGYNLNAVGAGYFQLNPIIVGVGGSTQKGGIGCGGGFNSSPGGPGFVLIASW